MKNQEIITKKSIISTASAIELIEASLKEIKPYNSNKTYTPKQREPYDALCDRFVRAVEVSIKFFRSYEKFLYAENSDTLRDLLNKMEKLNLITSVVIWIDMREIRNRIVHAYLPEEIKDIYNLIMNEFGNELQALKKKLCPLNFLKSKTNAK